MGEQACQKKRPCDQGDLDVHSGACVNGMREIVYDWADVDKDGEKDCDPTHTFSIVKHLPESDTQPCKQCSKGMNKDVFGNCNYCFIGTY